MRRAETMGACNEDWTDPRDLCGRPASHVSSTLLRLLVLLLHGLKDVTSVARVTRATLWVLVAARAYFVKPNTHPVQTVRPSAGSRTPAIGGGAEKSTVSRIC